jgi:uridylate kinase
VILKATKVDGIYDKDPVKHDDAVRFDEVTYMEVLQRGLKVMDATAVSLCMDNSIPIVVFDLHGEGNLLRVLAGEDIGTRVIQPAD